MTILHYENWGTSGAFKAAGGSGTATYHMQQAPASESWWYAQQYAAVREYFITSSGGMPGTRMLAQETRSGVGEDNISGSGAGNVRSDCIWHDDDPDVGNNWQTPVQYSSGDTIWQSFSWWFPNEFTMQNSGNFFGGMGDWHNDNAFDQANINFVVDDSRCRVVGYGGSSDGANVFNFDFTPNPVTKNTLYEWVCYFEWNSGSTGRTRMWLRIGGSGTATEIGDHTGPNIYTGANVYWKLANYHPEVGSDINIHYHGPQIIGTTKADVTSMPLENYDAGSTVMPLHMSHYARRRR